MNRLLLALVLIPLWACAREIPTATLVIDHVYIVDVRDGSVDEDMMLVLDGDRIRGVGRSGSLEVPDGTPRVDGTGRYAIPGLWDMHVHAIYRGPFWDPRPVPSHYEPFLRLFVAHGITGFREMSGDLELADQLRSERASGERLVPRFVMAGHVIVGHDVFGSNQALVATPADAPRVVDSLIAAGAGFIKVIDRVPAETYRTIAESAKRAGIRFAGHVPPSLRAREAAEAGQWTIEHLSRIARGCSSAEEELMARRLPRRQRYPIVLATQDSLRCDRLMTTFAEHGTWQVPTLAAHRGIAFMHDPELTGDPRLEYMPSSVTDVWGPGTAAWTNEDWRLQRQMLTLLYGLTRRANCAGVPILAGSDAPNPYAFPGSGLHDELELLVGAGLTPLQALRAATLGPALFLAATDSLGTLEMNKLADIVLLDGNPLEDINNVRRIHAVVLAGKLLDQEDLGTLLSETRAMVSETALDQT